MCCAFTDAILHILPVTTGYFIYYYGLQHFSPLPPHNCISLDSLFLVGHFWMTQYCSGKHCHLSKKVAGLIALPRAFQCEVCEGSLQVLLFLPTIQ